MWKPIPFQALFCFLFLLVATPAAFGTSIILSCSSVPLTNTDASVDCPGASALPADTTVTAVKLYLLSSFQGGQGSSVGFRIVFEPSTLLTDWTHGPTQVCDIRNDGSGGTTMVSNTCGIYSGDPNAPGTFTMSADHAFTALAASGFSLKVQRGDLGGTAESVLAAALVEYTYAPISAVPELPVSFLFATGLLGIGCLTQKNPRALLLRSNRRQR
jgi:hypothetical protein